MLRILIVLLGLGAGAFARAEDGTSSGYPASLDVPCRQSSATGCTAGLRDCREVLETDPKLPLIGAIEKRAAIKINGFYSGVDVNWAETKKKDEPRGGNFGGPVCNLVPNEYNGNTSEKEFPANPIARQRFGDCGKLARTEVTITRHQVAGVDVAEPDIDVLVKQDGAYGRREEGWYRGAKIQALTCFKRQIINELKSEKKLRIRARSPDGTPYCGESAKQILANLGETNRISGVLCEQQGVGDVGFCTDKARKAATEGLASDDPEVTQSRQSACFLEMARTLLEGAFMNLTFCELHMRAEEAYSKHFISEEGRQRIKALIQNEVISPCQAVAESEGNRGCESSSCQTNLVNHCYKNKVEQTIRRYIEELFPTNGNCTVMTAPERGGTQGEVRLAGSWLPLLLVGFLGKGRRRRRAYAKTGRAALFILLFALISGGCGSATATYGGGTTTHKRCTLDGRDSSVEVAPSPSPGAIPAPPVPAPSGVATDMTGCTEMRGSSDGPPICLAWDPDWVFNVCCEVPTPAITPASGAARRKLKAVASLSYPGCPGSQPPACTGCDDDDNTPPLNGGTNQSLSAAANLVDKDPPKAKDPSKLAANTSAATVSKGAGGKKDKGGPGFANETGLGRTGTGTGGGGGDMGGGSGGGGLGGASTAPGGNTSAGTSDGTLPTDAGGAYGAGGGAGGGAAAGNPLAAMAGLLGGEAGGKGGEKGMLDFGGKDPNDGGEGPSGTEDPADYFSRTKMTDSLFKIVERKYNAKQVGWIKQDADAAIKGKK